MITTTAFRIYLLVGGILLSAQASADTIVPQKTDIYQLQRTLENRKKRLDSTFEKTDAIMDSLTGRHPRYDKEDTMRMMYLMDLKKKKEEAESNRVFWMKWGILALIVGLGIGFYVWKKMKEI